MKNNYQIKLNSKKISSEDIAKYQDFDALLEKFAAQPLPSAAPEGRIRRLYVWGMAIAAVFAGLMVYNFFLATPNYEDQSDQYFASIDYVVPPVPVATPKFVTQTINANEGGVYEYRSGSKLVIPAASFVDDKGKLVEGEVAIKYREYHDFVDFFLSGIPMVYDSAGVKYTLESAGMMEVYAEQDGQRVKLAPGKTIDVELVSHVNVPANLNVPPKYNIYKLDKAQRNWVYQDLDKMQMVEDEKQEVELDVTAPTYAIQKAYQDKLKAIEMNESTQLAKIDASIPVLEAPKKPKQYTSSSHAFELRFNDLANYFDEENLNSQDAREFQAAKDDLRQLYEEYEQMLWAISDQSNISSSRLKSEFSEMDGIRIKKINNRDFEFTLIKDNTATKVIVNPILTGSDYDKALAKFNEEFSRFEAKRNERENALSDRKATLKAQIDSEKELAKADYEEKLAHYQDTNQGQRAIEHILKRKVINRFQATSLGVWNCDRPLPPTVVNFKANFKAPNGENYKGNIGYFVDKSRNTVSRFLVSENTPMSFYKNSENLMWLITDENKIAVYRPSDFKRINVGKDSDVQSFDFEMAVVDQEIRGEEDARKILHF